MKTQKRIQKPIQKPIRKAAVRKLAALFVRAAGPAIPARAITLAIALALSVILGLAVPVPASAGIVVRDLPKKETNPTDTEAAPFPTPLPALPPEPDIIEDAEPPFEVDWDEMRAINEDIIGYLYIDGMTNISYPILYSGEDDFYLHHNMYGEDEYAGSIFLEGLNTPDFADPNSILYGHNMANASMFGSLKYMNSQELYDRHPYFWIMTPEGNYRYKIFSMFYTSVDSDVYLLYEYNGPAFKRWEEEWQAASEVKNTVPLTTKDKTVCMTTCTSDASKRFVVFGKCVSSEKPVRAKGPDGLTLKSRVQQLRAEAEAKDEAEEVM